MKENKGNPVAKYMRKFNKATVQTDRKKAMKKGDRKHKGRYEEVSEKTFEPHMMYHPKTGDEVKAKTHQQHLDLKGKGYGHEKPETNETYRASMASRAAANKMYGRQHPEQDKPKTGVTKKATPGLDSKGRMVKDKNPTAARRKAGALSKAIAKKYGTKKEENVAESLDAAQKEKQAANLKLKHANQRVQLTKRHEKEKETLSKESMDPRDYTDKAGYVVVVTGRRGKQDIKNFFSTKPAAQKYADKVNKINKVGNKATVHKTDGRKLMKEDTNESTSAYKKSLAKIADKKKRAGMSSSDQNKMGKLSALMKRQKKEEVEQVDEATSAKLLAKMKELGGGQLPRSSVELRKLKAKAQDELRGARAAKKAEPKKVSKTSKGKTHTGSGDPADRNIIMQLRKAQDVGGNMDIRVSPTGKTVKLPKAKIDALLKKHDTIQKPRDKRMFNVQLTKALRKLSK